MYRNQLYEKAVFAIKYTLTQLKHSLSECRCNAIYYCSLGILIPACSVFVVVFSFHAYAVDNFREGYSTDGSAPTSIIRLWDRNYNAEYMRTQVDNLLNFSQDKFGPYQLVSSQSFEQGRAFANLHEKDGIDIFIGGIDKYREEASKVIYFPIDRGLLGYNPRCDRSLSLANLTGAFTA